MIVIDEYLAVRILRGAWPDALPDTDDLVLPTSRYWRLLQRIHSPGTGQLSQILSTLSSSDLDALRYPHPEVLQILDSRPLLDEAARLGSRFGGGWLIDETLAAGLHHGRTLWFGAERNVGRVVREAADELGITVHIAS